MAYRITELCKGCDSCVKVCPTSAISGEKKAVHEIDPEKCIECGVCGRICPTEGSILDEKGIVTVRIKKTDWPKPVVIRSLCSACGICVEICPFNCLCLSSPEPFPHEIKSNAYSENKKACVGCGLCADACLQEAIYMAREL